MTPGDMGLDGSGHTNGSAGLSRSNARRDRVFAVTSFPCRPVAALVTPRAHALQPSALGSAEVSRWSRTRPTVVRGQLRALPHRMVVVIKDQKSIVIVGGGFAGTTLARELDRDLPPDCGLLVISEESYMTFNPMLPEAVGASVFPEQVVAPIRQMLSRGRFIMGRVTAINSSAKSLVCDTLAGELTDCLRSPGARLRQPGAARPHPGTCRACHPAQDCRRRDAHPQCRVAAGGAD